MSTRRFYLVMVALLYAILCTQTAHAAKLPRRASAGELPQPVKLLVAQRAQDDSGAVLASSTASLSGTDLLLLLAGVLLGFGRRGFFLEAFAAAQRNLRAAQERLALTTPVTLTPLRI